MNSEKQVVNTLVGNLIIEGVPMKCIELEYPIQIGCKTYRADVVILKDNKPIYIFEAKLYKRLSISKFLKTVDAAELQLESYMRLLQCKAGSIVCDYPGLDERWGVQCTHFRLINNKLECNGAKLAFGIIYTAFSLPW